MESTVPVAFFSYSRHDSDFVLRLAKDLRTGGAQVWLDQLDIQPGQRWDSAVEAALAACPTMLLVLSPSSVDSTNVMDEVSYALEGRKLVVPVLFQDCKIPFRLRRVQYVDVRTDYDRGLQELLRMLSGHSAAGTIGTTAGPFADPASADGLSSHAPANEPVRPAAPDTPADTLRPPTPDSAPHASQRTAGISPRPASADSGSAPGPVQSSSRGLMIGVLAVVAIVGLVLGMRQMTSGSRAAPVSATREGAPVASGRPGSESPPGGAVEASIESMANVRWLEGFLQAQEGPTPRALRLYFADVVTPYYGLPSATWVAIEKDKQLFFSRFPTINYTRASEPRWTKGAEGNVLEFDMSFENVRKDGVVAKGRSHLKMTVRSVDGVPRIVGIEERSLRD